MINQVIDKGLSDQFIDYLNSIEDAAILYAISVFWPLCGDRCFCDLSDIKLNEPLPKKANKIKGART